MLLFLSSFLWGILWILSWWHTVLALQLPWELDLCRMWGFLKFRKLPVALSEAQSKQGGTCCFAWHVMLWCTTACFLSSSLLYSSAGEQCGCFPFPFQMHKMNLELESAGAAFPGLQSELVQLEHQQENKYKRAVWACNHSQSCFLDASEWDLSKTRGSLSAWSWSLPPGKALSFLCPQNP